MKVLLVTCAVFLLLPTNSQSQAKQFKNKADSSSVARKSSASQGNQKQRDEAAPISDDRAIRVASVPEVTIKTTKDAYDKALVWATGLLVAVGVFQIFYLWRTVEATKDNARAALLNAEAVISAERPWIVVTVEKHPIRPGHFFFRATNTGRTPAQLISGGINFKFKTTPGELPIPPDYEPFLAPNNRFLPPGDSFAINRTLAESTTGFRPESLVESYFARGEIAHYAGDTLFFYGELVYDDVLAKQKPGYVPHKTRWCFAFFRDGQRFIRTSPTGTDEYDRYT